MAVSFFQVQLSVKPKEAGEAELVLPKGLQEFNYQFVALKDGGEEGIIKLDTSEANLKTVEKEKNCKKLTEPQMAALKKSYPAPKHKQKYRSPSPEEVETSSESFALDDRGNRMSPSFSVKRGVRYPFYVSSALLRGRKAQAGSVARVSAAEIEAAILRAARQQVHPDDDTAHAPNDLIQQNVL